MEKERSEAHAAVRKTKTVMETTAHVVLKIRSHILEQHKEVCREKCCKLLAAHDPPTRRRAADGDYCILHQIELAVELMMQENRIDEVSKLISQATELSEKNDYAGPLLPGPEVKPSPSSEPPSAPPW